MQIKMPADNFFLGLFAGMATLMLSYLAMRTLRLALADHYGDPYFFPAPRTELVVILINMLLFRMMMVNMKRERTGKGILFSTVVLSMVFFFLFFKFNFRLP